MSDQTEDQTEDRPVRLLSGHGSHREDRARVRRRRGFGCVAVLVAAALLVGGAYFALDAGMNALRDQLRPPADYAGEGSGAVLIEVQEGESASDISRTLLERGVVRTAEAFTDAAEKNPDSLGIQAGFYQMRRQMSARSALAILVEPANLIQSTVRLAEGLVLDQIVEQLAKQTDFTRAEFRKVLRRPDTIALPAYARGEVEGYLFPATYLIGPDDGPRKILAMMVARYEQAARDLRLRARANVVGKGLRLGPAGVVTVASLIQAEARREGDFVKVSRVIYNRLRKPMKLQFDSTIDYAIGGDGKVSTTIKETRIDSPYNTYRYAGLPPTPINAPGEQALEAALRPAPGGWLYFVTTNPSTGKTEFTGSYREFLRFKAQFQRYCANSNDC